MPRGNMVLKPGLMPLSLKEKEYLERTYLKKNLSPAEIGEALNVSPRLIYSRLRAHGISKQHPITGTKKKFRSGKYCTHCGQSLVLPAY